MKFVFDKVKSNFEALVNAGYGEWHATLHEALGLMLYKYDNDALNVSLAIYENGFENRYKDEVAVVRFKDICNLDSLPTIKDIIMISRGRNPDTLIEFFVITSNKRIRIVLPFRISAAFEPLLCKILDNKGL